MLGQQTFEGSLSMELSIKICFNMSMIRLNEQNKLCQLILRFVHLLWCLQCKANSKGLSRNFDSNIKEIQVN